MQKEFEEVKSEMQGEIDASKQVNIILFTEIQKFKTQKLLTESNILQSNSFRQLRKESEELLKIIDNQQLEINQLKIVKDSFDKVKNDLSCLESKEKETARGS